MLARTKDIYLLSETIRLLYEEWAEGQQSGSDRNDWEVHKQDTNPSDQHNLLSTES